MQKQVEKGKSLRRLTMLVIPAMIFTLASLLLLNACTRSSIPIDATVTHDFQAVPEGEPTITPESNREFVVSGTYAVVWIPEDEQFKLRVPAGISGSIVYTLEYDTRGIHVTGNTTSLGSSLWVEIEGPDGEMGWVNSWNLTEDVGGEAFCTDPRVIRLLEKASEALLKQDAQQLLPLINPRRGLIIRHDWWNPEVSIRSSEMQNIFTSREDRDWGVLRGGDFTISGSFSEIIVPILEDVLSQTPTAVCKEIPSGVTTLPAEWPGEYRNLHFYAFHRPSPEGGNRFDWRTIVFGFEYLQGEPYLTLLVHFHGDI